MLSLQICDSSHPVLGSIPFCGMPIFDGVIVVDETLLPFARGEGFAWQVLVLGRVLEEHEFSGI